MPMIGAGNTLRRSWLVTACQRAERGITPRRGGHRDRSQPDRPPESQIPARAQLDAGDRLFVSAEVADYLDRLHELGVSQR